MYSHTMRSLSSALALVYSLLSLQSCSGTPMSEETPIQNLVEDTAAIEETVSVHVLSSQGDVGEALQQAVRLFSESRGDVIFSVHTISAETDYALAVRSRLLAGDRVDLFHVSGAREALEMLPHLEELSSLNWLSDALPGALDPISVDSKVYGVPYGVEGTGLLANRNIFEVAGIPLGAITSYESLEEALTQLNEQITSGELEGDFPDLKRVVQVAGEDIPYLSRVWGDILTTDAFAAPSQAAQSEYLTLPLAEEIQSFVALLSGLTPPSRWTEVSRRQQQLAFARGETAVILEDISSYSGILSENEALEGRIKLLPIHLEEQSDSFVYWSCPAYWAINVESSHSTKEMAQEFLTWLYRSEEGAKVLSGRLGILSPFQNADNEPGNSLQSQLWGYVGQGQAKPQLHREFPARWGEEVIAPLLQQYFSREITWEEVEQGAVEEWHRYRIRG